VVSAFVRRHGFAVAAAAVLAVDGITRIGLGEPYPGATLLLLVAIGLALAPLVPVELRTPSLVVAVGPPLAIAAFSALLTTVSIVGVPLTELSIRLAVGALVIVALAAGVLVGSSSPDVARRSWRLRPEALVLVGLLGLFALSLASSWDIVYPLRAEGTDWGHYLLYSDEVAAQKHLLIDDPYAGEENRIFADPPAVGALYGSFLILDGITSWSLAFGLVVVSALTVLSVFAAGAAFWGVGAGLAAGTAYAVAPIRLDPMYWHGLGTTLALLYVPLVVLALGFMYRGHRDWRTVGLLSLSLVGVAAAHSTSALVVAVLVAAAPVVDLVRMLLRSGDGRLHPVREWWRDGLVRPVLVASAVACVLGGGVVAHLGAQAASLGEPVSYRFLGPDWLDSAAIGGYFSWFFLAIVTVALVVVATSRRSRSDPALLALLALGIACVVVSQLWRFHFPFEYRRSVYYAGIAMVLLIGAAFARFRPRPVWIALFGIAFLYLAQLSIGLRLPERVLAGPEPVTPAVAGLEQLQRELDAGRLPSGQLLVSDSCLHFAVPYLVRRPTIPAFSERQVGFRNRLPLARKASAILQGGPEGSRLASELGVRYLVADPSCTPDLAQRVGGRVILENEELVIVQLPAAT
jgi:hypothetical protein